MTTEPLFDSLEICLQALDEGVAVESCLVLYPALADELRPILVAAVQARVAAVTDVPVETARRGKARVLQAAAEMREQQMAPPGQPVWRKKGLFGARIFRLGVTTVLVIAFLLTGGTRLVNASSGALPGDRLYSIKRSWEDVQLAFVRDSQAKAALEHQFDHERVQEIEALYSEKRIEPVNFQGVVESQQTGTWRIAGLNVAIDEETATGAGINSGATVRIVGETDDGVIKAGQITLIATPGVTPTAISSPTPASQTLPTLTPETGEDFGSGESENIQATKTPGASESSVNGYPTETRRPHQGDSGSTGGSGGDSGQTSQPSTDDPGEGGDN